MTIKFAVIMFAATAVVILVPVLFGISDRAAAFAGGLVTAAAAVIAVVMTAQLQRDNEALKDQRHRNDEIRVLTTELSIILAMVKEDLGRLNRDLNQLTYNRRNQTSPMRTLTLLPQKPVDTIGPTNSIWRILIERAVIDLPDRISSQLAKMKRPVAQSVMEYARLGIVLKENLAHADTYPPDKPLSDSNLLALSQILKNLETLARDAGIRVQEYENTLA